MAISVYFITTLLALCQGLPTSVYINNENNNYTRTTQVTSSTTDPNQLIKDGDVLSFNTQYDYYGNYPNYYIVDNYGYYNDYGSPRNILFSGAVYYDNRTMIGFPNALAFDFALDLFDYDANNTSFLQINYNTAVSNNYLTNVEYTINLSIFSMDYLNSDLYYTFNIDLWKQHNDFETYNLEQLDYYYEEGDLQETTIMITVSWRYVDLTTIASYFEDMGYNIGYSEGYAQGLDYGFSLGGDSQNAWRNILGAIIDTPILYLRKFFGYEVFGVNVYAMLATLISLIVALSIFRLIRSII